MDTMIRILLVCAMFVVTFASGFVPIAVMNSRRVNARKFGHAKRMQRACTCFAAGVFFGTSMLELLPNVKSKFAKVISCMKPSIFTHYPIAEFSMVAGFFLVLILEQVVLYVKERKQSAEFRSWSSMEMLGMTKEDECISEEKHDIVDSMGIMDQRENTSRLTNQNKHLSELLLLVVMSLHSVFEGLALGLQSDLASLWTIFAALALHKGIIAFSISMKMLKSCLSICKIALTMLVFSLMSPIGITIATIASISSESFYSNLVVAVLLGISTGTFLFITFVEILPQELGGCENRLMRLACLSVGCLVIAAIRLAPSVHTSTYIATNDTFTTT